MEENTINIDTFIEENFSKRKSSEISKAVAISYFNF